jgi:hypothetical protein
MVKEHKNKIKFFVNFLKEKNAYCKYIRNLLLDKGYPYYSKYIKENISSRGIFSMSFIWEKTKEGHDYWSELDEEYKKRYFETFH